MSSLANHQNQSTSAPMSETDNDDENEFDSSFNRQNESMMHKVKDVVSKLLHPSFLFSTNDETDRPKRKRSTSTEEQQTTTVTTDTKNGHTTTTSRSQYSRSAIREDEPQITDDEDSTSRDIPSPEQDSIEIEQQKKRRRTANYQNILSTKSTNGHHHHDDDDERTSSSIFSTDSVRFSSDRRIDPTSSTVQSSNERINRFTPAKQRFDILPTYRGSTSNYDPTKSPLFSAGNRKTTETTTTTNLKSNEFSANYLLASGLVSRPQPSSSISQPSPATLTHPTNTNRQMFGINYSSINSRRLPYIERLRRRTLQDCIRLNRTVDSEPLSESVIEEHKSTTASPVLKRVKAQEKECGIQCDISITESSIEPSKKIQSTFPPADIRNEALTMPTIERSQASNQKDSSIQTNSSITIERIPPKIDITKPKVLGDVTPFSWPKFARAQEEYAKKYPEKCHTDSVLVKSVVPSNTGSSNVSLAPPVLQQTNISTNLKMPMFSIPASRPAGDIWKCPSCTKEHPAQTATCSLCRQINPNYKKPSAIEPPVTTGKESVSSNKLPDVIAKEPSVPTPITTQIVPTTTKESVVSIPPATTTSISFPTFGVQPSTSLPITTKESSTSIIAPVSTSATTTTLSFGVPPIVSTAVATTKENPIITTSSITPSFGATTTTLSFGVPPIVSTTAATTKENPIITTSSITPSFGVPPIVSTTAATTKENPIITTSSITPSFGVPATVLSFGLPPIAPTTTAATTKENSIITTSSFTPSFGVTPMVSSPPATTATSIPPMFGTTATTFDKTSTISTNSPFSSSTTFQPFVPVSTTSPSVVITTSPAPLITSTASISFGTFGNASVASPPTTTAAAPVVSTVSSVALPTFSFTSSTPAPSLPTSTISNPFGTSPIVPTSTAATSAISFPVSSTSASTNPSSFTPATTTTTLIPFGSGGFNLVSASTTSNPLFSFAASSPPRPFAPPTVASTNSATVPAFGSIPPFGAASSFGTTPAFGTSATFGITPASSDKSASSVSSSSTFGILTTPPTFGFGFPSSTIQTSAPVASTGGFSFTPPTSTAPIFGAGPSPLSSGGSSNPFGFGGASTVAPVSTNLFQFSGTTPMNNDSVPTPTSSNLSEPYNPFDASSSDSSNSRPMLKAKRRRP